MRNLLIFIFISLLINSFNCSFQSKIFNRMNKEKSGENLIISPLSIFQALSLATNGAKGETQLEMLELLESDNIDELNKINFQIISLINKFSTVDIANAVMTKFTPLESFSSLSEKYLAPFEPLESAEQVNNWCSNKTHGKINKIIEDLDPGVLMIILNAVYFKGEWAIKFGHSATKELPFYNLGKDEINIDTMKKIDHFKYYEDKKVQAIELRFVDDFMSAIIILPAEGNDINKYINSLSISNDEYEKIMNGLSTVKVNLELPKFELEFGEKLNKILMDLGMYNAFDPFNADFSGIEKELNLYIESVIHKSYLKIFEDGCEAAAVTAIVMPPGAGMPVEEKIYDMKVNRPFLFLLKNSRLPAGYDLIFMSKIEKLE